MTKQITLFSALAASLLVSFAAQAADTAELKVKGVIRPSACTPSFTGTNVVDYGTISAKGLSATAANVLAEKTIAFTVTCDAATKVAVRAIDNKASTVVAGLMTAISLNLDDKNAYGLGAAGGKNIGAYSVRVIPNSFTADGATADVIYDNANNGTWAKSPSGHFKADGTSRKSFAATGTTTPSAYKTMSGNLGVTAVLDKGANLPLTQNIDLDGSATIEVQYL